MIHQRHQGPHRHTKVDPSGAATCRFSSNFFEIKCSVCFYRTSPDTSSFFSLGALCLQSKWHAQFSSESMINVAFTFVLALKLYRLSSSPSVRSIDDVYTIGLVECCQWYKSRQIYREQCNPRRGMPTGLLCLLESNVLVRSINANQMSRSFRTCLLHLMCRQHHVRSASFLRQCRLPVRRGYDFKPNIQGLKIPISRPKTRWANSSDWHTNKQTNQVWSQSHDLLYRHRWP